ncbi:MAG: tripartite tricarboxylate transporter TctB family protein [Ahrensia sp.]
MADRIFHSILLVIAIGYTIIAFTVIKAPFQYDPLGPESWPRLLGILAIACSAWIVIKPDIASLDLTRATLSRIGLALVILSIYAYLFQPLGFVFSTWLFCIALGRMLGAGWLSSVIFGAIAGIGGYLLFTVVLDLNLPAGVLEPIL